MRMELPDRAAGEPPPANRLAGSAESDTGAGRAGRVQTLRDELPENVAIYLDVAVHRQDWGSPPAHEREWDRLAASM